MNEIDELILIIGVALLYRLGGMGFHKVFRRYGIPILVSYVAIHNKKMNWKSALAICGSAIGFFLGYGEDHSWFERILASLMFSLPTLFIGFNWWIIAPPLTFIGTYILSNNEKTKKYFKWGTAEILVGMSIGILYSQVL